MPTKVTVPQLGEGVEEITIVNWLKSEGDRVDEYEGLVEVETDKVVTEIASPATGTLIKILVPQSDVPIPVGEVLAWIGEPGENIPDAQSPPLGSKPDEAEYKWEQPSEDLIPESASRETQPNLHPVNIGRDNQLGFISPLVAKMAAENQIDLTMLSGTGLGGRITKKDILEAVENQTPKTSIPDQPPPASSLPGRLIPHTNMRKRIAEHMVMSKRTSPHVTTLMEVDLSRVTAHRQANKEAFIQNSTRLTFTAYFILAAVDALKAYPLVNSSWREDGILVHESINIGMATDLGEEGLIVPVIKNASDLSLMGVAREVNRLANLARSKKLSPADVQGATFSITNHGVSGSLLAVPIINQPQCAILGVGAIQKRVVVVEDEFGNDSIAIRPMAYLTLTFDHRILDGAGADHFLAAVIKSLEGW